MGFSKAEEFGGTSKRRRCTMVKSCGFDKIPEDVLTKILARLPAKRATRAMCVSQLWYSVISSRYFTKLFLESPSSAKRPRFLASRVDSKDQNNYVFLTSTQDNHSDSSVYVFDHTLKMPGLEGYFVNALRGLICLRLGTSVRICNLTTRQRVYLPTLTSTLLDESSNDNIWSYFGYDHVYDEYKVITTVWEVSKEEGRVVRSEHQVLVLGPGASWRYIQSIIPPPPHRPYSRGISIDNVLYYGAWIDKNQSVLVSFDLANEDFDLIELPTEAGIVWNPRRANLMNYQGKLAVFEYSQSSVKSVNMWIMEDVGKKKWSNKTLVFPLDSVNMEFVYDNEVQIPITMAATDHRSEVRLRKIYHFPLYPEPYVIYDLEKNKITKSFKFSPLSQFLPWSRDSERDNGLETVIWKDDIESIMYLET